MAAWRIASLVSCAFLIPHTHCLASNAPVVEHNNGEYSPNQPAIALYTLYSPSQPAIALYTLYSPSQPAISLCCTLPARPIFHYILYTLPAIPLYHYSLIEERQRHHPTSIPYTRGVCVPEAARNAEHGSEMRRAVQCKRRLQGNIMATLCQ